MDFSLAGDIWWSNPGGTKQSNFGAWKLVRATAYGWGDWWGNYHSQAQEKTLRADMIGASLLAKAQL